MPTQSPQPPQPPFPCAQVCACGCVHEYAEETASALRLARRQTLACWDGGVCFFFFLFSLHYVAPCAWITFTHTHSFVLARGERIYMLAVIRTVSLSPQRRAPPYFHSLLLFASFPPFPLHTHPPLHPLVQTPSTAHTHALCPTSREHFPSTLIFPLFPPSLPHRFTSTNCCPPLRDHCAMTASASSVDKDFPSAFPSTPPHFAPTMLQFQSSISCWGHPPDLRTRPNAAAHVTTPSM